MNEVLSVLFKTIPGILYEPVACCTVVGLILAVWMCRENRHTFFWLIVCSLFFMVGWRCGIRITSNRYGAVLIYPAVIAAERNHSLAPCGNSMQLFCFDKIRNCGIHTPSVFCIFIVSYPEKT